MDSPLHGSSGRKPRTSTGILCLAAVLAWGCGGGDAGSDAGQMEESRPAADATAPRSACDVLTGSDASTILGQTLEARLDPDDQGPRHSSCGYHPGEGFAVLYLTVYWQGGQNEWDTWLLATSYAGQVWEQAEKVDLDSITGASLVSGLGDRAFYGGILPSLVLKGDVLLEFKMPLVTDTETNFPLLAQAALARLD